MSGLHDAHLTQVGPAAWVAPRRQAVKLGGAHTVFVTVLADDAVEASLLAAQMASRHGIATAVHPLIT